MACIYAAGPGDISSFKESGQRCFSPFSLSTMAFAQMLDSISRSSVFSVLALSVLALYLWASHRKVISSSPRHARDGVLITPSSSPTFLPPADLLCLY
jgi:hypothetical protein